MERQVALRCRGFEVASENMNTEGKKSFKKNF